MWNNSPTEISNRLGWLDCTSVTRKSFAESGFGPRFLHSTGQLHKGDSGKGFFIQFVSDVKSDLAIPDNAGDEKSSISFGVLIKAQAFGYRQALLDNKRRVITFDLGTNASKELEKIKI